MPAELLRYGGQQHTYTPSPATTGAATRRLKWPGPPAAARPGQDNPTSDPPPPTPPCPLFNAPNTATDATDDATHANTPSSTPTTATQLPSRQTAPGPGAGVRPPEPANPPTPQDAHTRTAVTPCRPRTAAAHHPRPGGDGADRAGAELRADAVHGFFGREPGLACLIEADLPGDLVGGNEVIALQLCHLMTLVPRGQARQA
jgi:hypothetical protein